VSKPCPLCEFDGGEPVWRSGRLRVVRVEDTPDHPAFYRVIWNAHVAEFSDLSPEDRAACMDAVVRVERVLRQRLWPAKVNIASLGNLVPHLHWHVVPRFEGDAHFPYPIWAPPQRSSDATELARLRAELPALDRAVAAAMDEA
jgi:diadenosine tetraphosphate (Ap4A) HIT family hydrolase